MLAMSARLLVIDQKYYYIQYYIANADSDCRTLNFQSRNLLIKKFGLVKNTTKVDVLPLFQSRETVKNCLLREHEYKSL